MQIVANNANSEKIPIILAATPIGNIQDASPRLCEAIMQADIIAAEDTRKLLLLTNLLSIKTKAKIISCHEHNEIQRVEKIIQEAQNGKKILVVSDAGMPTVSDPGLKIIQKASELGIKYTVIPGPSAPLTALVLSAMPTDKFIFEGFLPRKNGEMEKLLNTLKNETRTTIFFESPKRTKNTIQKMLEILGPDRKIAICRELTKIHEEVIRGTLKELAEKKLEILGEVTLVLQGSAKKHENPEKYLEQINQMVENGYKFKQAVRIVADSTGISKNKLYNVALSGKLQEENSDE